MWILFESEMTQPMGTMRIRNRAAGSKLFLQAMSLFLSMPLFQERGVYVIKILFEDGDDSAVYTLR
jgi:DUF971 family protein